MLGGVVISFVIFFNPESIFEQVENKIKEINDYTCLVDTYERAGKDEMKNIHRYYYKKPGWIRVSILEGDNKGAQALYNPNERKVKGRGGGALKFIKVSLPPENKRVQSPRGFMMNESDFSSNLNFLKRAYKNSQNTTVEDLKDKWKIKIEGIKNPEEFKGFKSIEVLINKNSNLFEEITYYEPDGSVGKRTILKDIQINVGLKESDFEI